MQLEKVKIIEAEVCPDHVHMLLEIPPKVAISSFMGYLKGKSSLMIYEKYPELKYKYRNREFWCRGYYVDTAGKNAKKIEDPNCKAALRWWCNEWGTDSQINIEKCRLLKEFMIENPPEIPISDGCCKGAKKDVAHSFLKETRATINLVGIRKAEGGARATAYNSCFSEPSKKNEAAQFRPLFFITDQDKELYCERRGVVHSALYEKHGFKRTGCACCPFGSKFEQELQTAEQLDPRLAIAARNIFGAAYEYTRAYRKFKAEHDAEKKGDTDHLSMF